MPYAVAFVESDICKMNPPHTGERRQKGLDIAQLDVRERIVGEGITERVERQGGLDLDSRVVIKWLTEAPGL